MRLCIDIGIHLNTRQSIETAVLDTHHKGYMYGVVGIFILSILDLINIVERLVIQTSLVEQGLRPITALDIRGQPTGSPNTYIQ